MLYRYIKILKNYKSGGETSKKRALSVQLGSIAIFTNTLDFDSLVMHGKPCLFEFFRYSFHH